MILITSAAFCPSEFGVEFGKIPPSFLPLGGKRLYEFQARLFKDFSPQRLVLSLPQGFKISKIEVKRLESVGFELIFVPQRLNLAQSINYCLNMLLPLKERLIILHGDSYFLNLVEASNALGISKALNSYDWVSLNDTNIMPFNVKDSQNFTLQSENELFKNDTAKNVVSKFTSQSENVISELAPQSENLGIKNATSKATVKKAIPKNDTQERIVVSKAKTQSENEFFENISNKNTESKNSTQAKIATSKFTPQSQNSIPKKFSSKATNTPSKPTTQKLTSSKEFVLNGYFCIQSPYDFIRSMLKASYDFILALKIYSQTHPFELLLIDEWFDFGLLSAYFNSKSSLTTQRIFNDLALQDGYLIKSSKDKAKIRAEFEWFKALPEKLSLFVPRVLEHKDGYKIEYLCLNTLAEIFVFSSLPSLAYKQIFASLKDFLEKLHSLKSKQSFDFNYKKKTVSRLKELERQRGFNLNLPFKFNGKVLPSLLEMLDFLDEVMPLNKEQCFIHGDFCFSNIFYDFRTQRIICFDPRGMDFSSTQTPFGDENYDLAKLAHSILGLYDFIIFGFYECEFKVNSTSYEINFSLPINENIKEIQALFLASFKLSKSEFLALCVHLFLSMLPLHYEDTNKQNALLANALRLFSELLRESKKSKQKLKLVKNHKRQTK